MARIGSDEDTMYVYNADLYCKMCGEEIAESLRRGGKEDTEDSCEFPQVALISQSETDCPNHCADCNEYLPQPLTSDGVEYVIERIRDHIVTCATTSPGSIFRGNPEVLDVWALDVSNYDLDTEQYTILDLYKEIRETK